MSTSDQQVANWLQAVRERLSPSGTLEQTGRLVRAAGLVLEASGLRLPVGSLCRIEQHGLSPVPAEVVGFDGQRLFLMPAADVQGLMPGARVRAERPRRQLPSYPLTPEPPAPAPWSHTLGRQLPVGESLLGRVLDATGQALDRLGPLGEVSFSSGLASPINPIERQAVDTPLDVGVRAINAMLTVGEGQRIGLFAGSGVGKSVLLGMMARYTTAEIIVVGLIGERGREVREFIEQILGQDGLRRSVVVAAPADASPLMRLNGATYATALAEFFRDRGYRVLLIMDSLTRYAMAQREIALAVGEPPATRGYPPSVFARLPALVERAGNGAQGQGSITAFYTVLTEGDDPQDPIADSARAILDGHVVLDRQLAESGHYPAIDIEQSISRVMPAITDPLQQRQARWVKGLYSRYRRARDLISIGAYVPGSDPELDRAIAAQADIVQFLQQDLNEAAMMADSLQGLADLALRHGGPTA